MTIAAATIADHPLIAWTLMLAVFAIVLLFGIGAFKVAGDADERDAKRLAKWQAARQAQNRERLRQEAEQDSDTPTGIGA
jgi:hypothetical protein